jgi:hypothetical protein
MKALRPMFQEPEKDIFLKAELDISHHMMLYPRVSTREQMKNVSAEMQQDKTFALLHGWTEDLIIMDTSDLGLSDPVLLFRLRRRLVPHTKFAWVVVIVGSRFRCRLMPESVPDT